MSRWNITKLNSKLIFLCSACLLSPISICLLYFYTFNTSKLISGNKEVTVIKSRRGILILFATVSGTSKTLAHKLFEVLKLNRNYDLSISDILEFDEEKLDKEDIVLFIVSTWSDGEPVESAKRFYNWLREISYDFRVSKDYLKSLNYSIFGLGGQIYQDNFCKCVS